MPRGPIGRYSILAEDKEIRVYTTNVLILALENGFSEIIYLQFGGRQNIFSIIFATKFVVICAAKILKIG